MSDDSSSLVDSPLVLVPDRPALGLVRGVLPGFTRPTSQRLDPPDPTTVVDDPDNPASSPDNTPGPGLDRYGPDERRSVPADTRTPTSATGDEPARATPREVGELVAALIAAAAVGVGLLVRWRFRDQVRLRQPTRAHTEAVGLPLGRIAARHVPLGKLTPDLRDLVVAAVGVNDYLDAGPVLLAVAREDGVPDNLQET